MQFLSYLINGISLGSVYALIALGYTMVYGIAKMLNFAHGDVIMIGSYVIFFAFGSFGLNPIVSVLLSMVVCTILGITMERVAYRPLREAPSLAVLITAIGVSYLLQQVAQLAWTSNPKSFISVVSGLKPISLFGGQLTISAETVVTIIACIVIGIVFGIATCIVVNIVIKIVACITIRIIVRIIVRKSLLDHPDQHNSEDNDQEEHNYDHDDAYSDNLVLVLIKERTIVGICRRSSRDCFCWNC